MLFWSLIFFDLLLSFGLGIQVPIPSSTPLRSSMRTSPVLHEKHYCRIIFMHQERVNSLVVEGVSVASQVLDLTFCGSKYF